MHDNLAITSCSDPAEAERDVKALQRGGFEMRKVSVIGRFSAFRDERFGMLSGAALVFVPLLGHVVVLGPLAGTFAGALEGTGVGGRVGAVVDALFGLGIDRGAVLRCAREIHAGKLVLAVHGDAKEVDRAREILASARISTFESAAH